MLKSKRITYILSSITSYDHYGKIASILVLAALWFIHLNTLGQLNQTKRIEINLKESKPDQNLYLFGEQGFVLRTSEYLSPTKQYVHKFEKFNNDMVKTSSKVVSIDKIKGERYIYSNNKKIWIIYHTQSKGEIKAISYSQYHEGVEEIDFKLLKNIEITDYVVSNRFLYIGGVYKKQPILCQYDLQQQRLNYLDLSEVTKKARFEYIKTFKNSDKVHVLMNEYDRTLKRYTRKLSVFDENGFKIINQNPIQPIQENRFLTSCSSSDLGGKEVFAIGMHAPSPSSYSTGIYITKFDDFNRSFIQFYDFTDFKNFFEYKGKNERERLEKKKKRKEAHGKKLTVSYRIEMHEIQKQEGQFIFVGEAYYPTYRTVSYTSTGPGGTPIVRSRSVFDGYQYTHAIVASFDELGNINWCNTFKLDLERKPLSINRNVALSFVEDMVNVAYCSGTTIKSISFKNGEMVQEKQTEPIDTGSEQDRIKNWQSIEIDYWYDNYFIINGTQRIVNSENLNAKRKRKVFFINKIKY